MSAGGRPYFAFGLNMHPGDMAGRCPNSVLLGTAVLPGHRFVINRLGVATVVPQAGARVEGALWQLAPGDERTLDRFEQVAARQYRKVLRPVRSADGQTRRCLVYAAADARPGRPSRHYMKTVLEAARHLGLSTIYIRELAGWQAGQK